MKLSQSRLVPVLGSALLLALFAALRLLDLGLLERVEAVSYDVRVRAAPAESRIATNLGCIFIDDRTIDAVRHRLLGAPYGLYWPRHVYGRLLEEAVKEGAQTVAFDVLFNELRPDLGGMIRGERFYETSDEFLAEQIRECGNVILACENESLPADLFATNAAALGDITTEKDADGVLRRVKAFRDYRIWHPAFKQVEADPDWGVNLLTARVEPGQLVLPRLDAEDIVIPLDVEGCFQLADFYGEPLPEGVPERALPFETRRVWHMGIVLAAMGLGLDLDAAQIRLDQGQIVLSGQGIERVLPVDSEGRFYIDWAIPVNSPKLAQEPAETLLVRSEALQHGTLDAPPRHWAGKLVVVGSTATGNDLADLGATPLDRRTFLVSKHWNVANSIITGRFIRRGTPAQESLIACGLALIAGFIALTVRPLTALAFTVGGLAAYVFAAFLAYAQQRLWLPIVLPSATTLSVYLVITTWRVVFEQSERRHVKSVFSKLVSPDVVSELLSVRELSLGGARREITVFFADVRGFTTLTDQSQQRTARQVRERGLQGAEAKALIDQQAKATLNTVNLYLALVADAVKQHNGTLDKYIGDCVMAFWGAPTPNSQHALHCVLAAIDAQRAIDRVNRQRAHVHETIGADEQTAPLLSLGTGINTGEATVGLMGSDAHILNYTVFGREVNVASRLEGVSGRGRIIISETTFAHILRDDPNLAGRCIPLESVSVKGISEAVKIYEVPWQERESPMSPPAG